MQYTEKELAQLIETVETEFTAHLSKAESLAKSEGGFPPKKEEKKPEDKKPEDKKPEAEGKPEGKPEAEAAPAEGAAPAAPAEAAPAPAADGAAPAGAPDASGYDAEDMAHMDKMYASMSTAELKAHHDSIRRALDAQTAQAPAPAAAAPAAPAPEMGKSEIKDENPVLNSKPTDKGNETNTAYNKNSGGAQASTGEPKGSPGAKSPASKAEGVQMDKSEKDFDLIKNELEAEKAKGVELKKNFDAAQEFLTKLVGKIAAPKAKAITEIAALTKNEDAGKDTSTLSKSEITEVLMKKSSDPKLSKADRDAINSFYLNKTDISTINHLLKN